MSALLEELITEGKRLLQRVGTHYTTSPAALPPEQRVTVAELEAWYRGVSALLESQFGLDSQELRVWRERRAEASKRSWDMVWRGDSPEGESFAVQVLAESIGTLMEIKISRMGTRSTPGNTLGFATLHPTVAGRSGGLFATGAYDDAVFAAFKTVEEEVRRRSGADATDIGVNLISKAMGQKSPMLQLSNIAPEQEAFHSLFRGAIGAFKNPLSHRSVNHADPVRVLELLAFASLLMRLLGDLGEVH